MSKELTIKDFEGLSIPKMEKKLEEVNSIEFLSELEKWEKDNGMRTGALAAINERQGILVDKVEVVDVSTEEGAKRLEEVIESDDEQKEEISKEETGTEKTDVEGELGADGPPEEVHGEQPNYAEGIIDTDVIEPWNEEQLEEYRKQVTLDTIEKIKQERLELDRIAKLGERQIRIGDDFQDSIFLAKAWLGKLIEKLGGKNPYKDDNANGKIAPTADVDESTEFFLEAKTFGNTNSDAAILKLRDRLQESIDRIDDIELMDLDLGVSSRHAAICKTQAWVNATNAKFFLGADLQKLKS